MRYDLPEPASLKSSSSGAEQPECTEHRIPPDGAHSLRDSKRPELGTYEFSAAA
ncbi:DUF397 domain-containing protein [Streptomyces mirabilis]|uniref:DUF397 domain-containing protein n=1 Tax=Streptomyces mirabilis TaxID=68239 RepID=UPI0036AEDADF